MNSTFQQPRISSPFSLYIHYPFCIKRCHYCGFATAVETARLSERYRDLLTVELTRMASSPPWKDSSLHTIYFGGGTPSLMPPEYLHRLLHHIGDLFEFPADIEITLEANPETRDAASFRGFFEAGVNRLSMGAQSFIPGELEFLGRAHSAEGVREAVGIARKAGFSNISLDLMYGIPRQSVESFMATVETALSTGVEHLSAYTLSIEENTPFQRRIKAGRQQSPDPDLMADQYEALIARLHAAGCEHYELTNYCKPGYRSLHNSAYWERRPYLGIGCGAHSFDGRRRFWNRRDTRAHLAVVESGEPIAEGEEILNGEMVEEESVYLGLRTRNGICGELTRELCSTSAVESLVREGYLEWVDDRLRVVEEKWLMLDDIVLRVMKQ